MANVIDREALLKELQAGDIVVLEALPEGYYEREHLPGAKHLPLDNLEEIAPRVIPNLETPVVTYCANGACENSAIAADRLEDLGYVNVRTFPGGKEEWATAGLPFEEGR